MRHLSAYIVFLFLAFGTYLGAQQVRDQKNPASITPRITEVQTGLLGLWVSHQSKLSNKWALRTEIGTNWAIAGSSNSEIRLLTTTPLYLSIEPRYYYNLDKRRAAGKSIANSSGNYFGLRASVGMYGDNMSEILQSIDGNDYGVELFWGIRRNLGKRWFFEAGVGGGMRYSDRAGIQENFRMQPSVNGHFRIGYRI